MNKKFFGKLSNLFESLSSKPRLGGFQITDSSLKYLEFGSQENPQTFSVNLPPGVVSEGKIQDENKFLYYAKVLYNLISPENSQERIRTVVCLPSAITYTQNYSIPNVGRERLKETAELNLESISPIPTEEAYMSWQLIKETEDKFELLGAFAEAKVVDKFKNLMKKAGFSPMIFEFPPLSLSWAINNEFGSRPESFLILNVSGDGIDLFLLRNGAIYFDYFRSWRSIQGNKRKISREDLNRVVVEEVRKVSDFSSSHFNESLKYVFVLAPGLEKNIKSLVESNFRAQAAPLKIGIEPLASSWYAVLGSALRGNWNRARDRYVSLGTFRVREIFFRQQIVDFIELWRNIFLGVVSAFLIMMVGAYFLLNTQPRTLKERLKIFEIDLQREEIVELRNSVGEFNTLVDSALEVKKKKGKVGGILEETKQVVSEEGLTIDSLNITSANSKVSLSGKAPNSSKVIEFKDFLIEDPRFQNVSMPFSDIFTSQGGAVTFDVSFKYSSAKKD